MFEGKSLMSYFEIGHILCEGHNINSTEYNAMLPWHLDVKLALIRRDQDEKKT